MSKIYKVQENLIKTFIFINLGGCMIYSRDVKSRTVKTKHQRWFLCIEKRVRLFI